MKKRYYITKGIFISLTLLTMYFIWWMSSMDATQSGGMSGGIVKTIVSGFINVFNIELDAAQLEYYVSVTHSVIRKMAHFTEFAVLSILMCYSFSHIKRYKLFALIFTVLYAVSDEIHQKFVIGRFCSVWDMIIDSSGAVLGIIIVIIIEILLRKYNKKIFPYDSQYPIL